MTEALNDGGNPDGHHGAANSLEVPLLELYKMVFEYSDNAIHEVAFAWLLTQLRFDTGAIITSFNDQPAYLDAGFHGYVDPSAMLASWGEVQHLDILSPRLLSNPGRVQCQDLDDAEIAGDRYAPLRDHLQRYQIRYSLCIGIPPVKDNSVTVLVVTRRSEGDRFSGEELAIVERLAPHLCLALAIARDRILLQRRELGFNELPVALADRAGRLIHTTEAFNALFRERGANISTTQLTLDCLQSLVDGKNWPLADQQHVLHGTRDDSGWLLRIHHASPLDGLGQRERQVAMLYASGMSRKEIARELGSSPATVKNQLSHCFQKLGVSSRKELMHLVQR